MHTILQPQGWPKPRGYANGIAASGRLIFVAGQIGWNAKGEFESDDLVGQFRQALENVVAVLREAGAGPEHLVSMTWYLLDREEYLANLGPIGEVWRAAIGRHYPAMAVVEISGLVESRARIEIQAMAVLPG
jgi:enamine deaminase RidA (YjgF/YER057c/UK114 family)